MGQGVELTCDGCGATFIRFKSQLNYRTPRKRYCSRACRKAHYSAVDRFWELVEKTETCWLWRGAVNPVHKYGVFGLGRGATVRAHRFAWEITNGPIPKGQSVLHRCDVRRCVRPDHLFLGTQADNIDDMHAKDRAAIGSRHGNAKLTEGQVRHIRQLAKDVSEATIAAVAQKYGVSRSLVSMIASGKRWKHVDEK